MFSLHKVAQDIFRKKGEGYGNNTKFGSKHKWNWFNSQFQEIFCFCSCWGLNFYFPCHFPFNSSSRELHHSYKNELCIIIKSLVRLSRHHFAIQTLISTPLKTLNYFPCLCVFYDLVLYMLHIFYYLKSWFVYAQQLYLSLSFLFEIKCHVS